jgi:hypothetical protein
MKPYTSIFVSLALAILAACGCKPQKSTADSNDAGSKSPKDTAFVAKPTPLEAVTAWAAAIKSGDKSAHDKFSLNEQDHALGDWDTRLAEATALIQRGAFVPGEAITDESLAVVLLKNSASPDRICLVKVSEGWCVLASISTWEAVGNARLGNSTDVLNAINTKVMQAQLRTLKP